MLWCLAIRHAVLEGSFDGVHGELQRLGPERAAVWEGRLREAETHEPAHFDHNGWVVQALQGAWSAISRTLATEAAPASAFPARHLRPSTVVVIDYTSRFNATGRGVQR